MSTIARIVVRGTRDPRRFAGFSGVGELNDWLDSMNGGRHEPDTSEASIGETEPYYVADSDLRTLIASPEFQKLNREMKAAVLSDPELTEAFASFIRDSGSFRIRASDELLYLPGERVIVVPAWVLSPPSFRLGAAFFSLAHEIYHNKYRLVLPGIPVTREVWAKNESIATYEAYWVTVRVGLSIQSGLSMEAWAAVNIVRGSSDKEGALRRLQEHYEEVYKRRYER